MKSKRHSPLLLTLLYGMIAGLLLGITALTLFLVLERLRPAEALETGHFKVADEAQFDGLTRLEPPVDLPDFRLIDQHGAPLHLSDLRGRHVLLTFGFTNCPDICPQTLSDLQLVKAMLGESADLLAFVFVSVDGSRDKPAVLRRYLEYRELHGIIGLTGSESDLRKMGAPFGLAIERGEVDSSGAYTVNHTVGAFLLDGRGRWIMRFQFGAPPERIAAELLQRLS